MNDAICHNTVSFIQYSIAKRALQILYKGVCKRFNTIFITTPINDKAETHEFTYSSLEDVEEVEGSKYFFKLT